MTALDDTCVLIAAARTPSLSGLLMAAGVLVLFIAVLAWWRGTLKARAEGPGERARPFEGPAARRAIHDAESIVDGLTAHLDARIARLERLIGEADRRIARLGGTLEEPGRRAAASAASESRSSGRSGGRAAGLYAADTQDPISREVCSLADQGVPTVEIARRLDEQIGKVELILALRAP